jgi:glycosyltransferase involved in cell wall biosynthesis
MNLPEPPIAITTLPIVADLIGMLPARRWVYYCVDDFGQWPGLDHGTLREMESRLVKSVDVVVTVSENLRQRIQSMGKESHLLTHGVDLERWSAEGNSSASGPWLKGLEHPLIMFWGLIDRRLDSQFLRRLNAELREGTIVLIGPEDSPDPELCDMKRVVRVGAVPYEELPALASQAAALIMPYANLPVTQAIQPLKLKEYLATGKPTIVRDLPAVREWSDCLDLSDDADEFVRLVRLRLAGGLPKDQRKARERLQEEGWLAKAELFDHWLNADEAALRPSPVVRKPEMSIRVVLETRVVSGTGGGPDKTILNSPRFLVEAGYRTICAYMHSPGDPGFEEIRKRALTLNAPLLSVEDRGPFDWRLLGRFLRICRQENVAIWHGHDYKSNLLGVLLRSFWPMHLVTTVHGWVQKTRRTPIYYAIDRLCLPFYEKVICVSEDLQKRCLESRVRRERCVLVENAVDTEQFTRQMSVAEAKRACGCPPNHFLIGAVGRLSAEKNFEWLVRCVVQLIRSGLDLSLWIIGDGNERARLQKVIDQSGYSNRVRLLGYRSDTIALYQAMDVLALSSIREGLPNVVLEAMALELPVVATRIAGIPRLIENEHNGLVIEPGNTEACGRALSRLYEDSQLRSRLGREARHTIELRYSFRARMQKILDIYEDVLAN